MNILHTKNVLQPHKYFTACNIEEKDRKSSDEFETCNNGIHIQNCVHFLDENDK